MKETINMENKKFDYRSGCGFGFRHFLTTSQEMKEIIENPNVSHCHPQYELYYLVSGHAVYTVSGRKYDLHPGDVMCVHAFENHSIKVNPDEDYERYVLEFEMNNIPSLNGITPLGDYFTEQISSLYLPSKYVKNSNILNYFKEIKRICSNKNKYTNHFLLGEAIKLVSELRLTFETAEGSISSPQSDNAKYEVILNKITSYISSNISKKITIDDIAKNVFLSRSYLQHMFKQYVGIPITEYIFTQKMHIARFMLTNGSSLNEVSNALGYKYYSTFCMHYKKFFGITPKNHGNEQ